MGTTLRAPFTIYTYKLARRALPARQSPASLVCVETSNALASSIKTNSFPQNETSKLKMEVTNNMQNYMHETTVVQTKTAIFFREMLYMKIRADMTTTCVKVMYIPQGRNRYRRGRASRAMQTTTTTIQTGQERSVQTMETTLPPSAQAALIQAMENLTIHGRPWNARPEFTPSFSARQGAIPRPASTKVLRSSKNTMIKN